MVSGVVPPERVAALRRAFDAMVADAEFLADAEKMKLLVTPMTGDVVTRHAESTELYATPAAVRCARPRRITGDWTRLSVRRTTGPTTVYVTDGRPPTQRKPPRERHDRDRRGCTKSATNSGESSGQCAA